MFDGFIDRYFITIIVSLILLVISAVVMSIKIDKLNLFTKENKEKLDEIDEERREDPNTIPIIVVLFIPYVNVIIFGFVLLAILNDSVLNKILDYMFRE